MRLLYALPFVGLILSRLLPAGITITALYLLGIEQAFEPLVITFGIVAIIPNAMILAIAGVCLKLLGVITWGWLGVFIPALSVFASMVLIFALMKFIAGKLSTVLGV